MIALYKYNVEVYSTALEVQDFPYFRLIKMLLTMQIKVRLFRQRCYMYAVTKLYYVHLLKVKRNPLTQQHQSVSQSFLKMSYMKYAIILSNTVKHQTPDQKMSVKIAKNPEISWFGNLLVRNIVGRNLLVRNLCVPGVCWSESSSSGFWKFIILSAKISLKTLELQHFFRNFAAIVII